MFQDGYKECNERIRLDPAAEKRIKAALRNAEGRRNKRAQFYGHRLAAAAAVIVVVFLLVPLFAPGGLYGKSVYVCDSYEDILDNFRVPNRDLCNAFVNFSYMFDTSESTTTIPLPAGSNAQEEGYSTTNIQVEGVDEADVVKTDGEYLYIVSAEEHQLYIVRANNGNPMVESSVSLSMYDFDRPEIFLYGDYLAVCNGASGSGGMTLYSIYDIKDRAEPKLLNKLMQSGAYVAARMIGNVIYTASLHNVYFFSGEESPEYKTYIPKVRGESGLELLAPEDIYYCPGKSSNGQYIVLTAFAIDDSDEFRDHKALLGISPQVYADRENFYICSYNGAARGGWIKETYSSLLRFAIHDGEIELAASGKVPGAILNQFSMDAYDGTFRIATTVNSYKTQMRVDVDYTSGLPYYYEDYRSLKSTNGVYVFDEDLNLMGSVEGLAEGERIYAVRFDGETGYVVTFRQTDPLFQIDLSNPRSPVVTDALKMPGVSRYLHIYDDDLIFGLGETGTERGLTGGIKLSMFRRADGQTSLREVHSESFKDALSYALPESHKAIFVNSDRALIGFPVSMYGKYYMGQVQDLAEYQLYRYTESDGFQQVAAVELSRSDLNSFAHCRGLYIGDYFYVISPDDGIKVLSLEDFAQKAEVRF